MDSRLFLNHTSTDVIDVAHPEFDIQIVCRSSPDHPDSNEDAVGSWIFPDGSWVVAVADGMGGTPAGRMAARLTIERLDRILDDTERADSMRSPILDAFEAANADVLAKASGSGTTLVVAEITGGKVRTYNVGDSGALLVGQRGRVKAETTDHSPVGYGVAAGLIDADTAMQHEDRHYLSNFVGTREMHIEVGIARVLAPLDTLLLASDGLFDNLEPREIIDTVRCGNLRRAAETLGARVQKKMEDAVKGEGGGKPDDLTMVLARRRKS